MIKEYKMIGDKFSHISSECTDDIIFDKGMKEIIDLLKKYNFNVEDACALLLHTKNCIEQASIDLIHSQELKNLF